MTSNVKAEAVTFHDAIVNVEVLDEIHLPDPQPCIEAQAIQLQYRVDFSCQFQDKDAYITGVAKYSEEACRHAQLNEMLEHGFQHAVNLYTWRCCSRSVPVAKSNEQPNRLELYQSIVEVLYPEVKKLLDFMYFQNSAIEEFCTEFKRLCHHEKRKDFVSESYLLTLGKFLNMFAVLDELKNMKASIKNDYSTFRRAAQFLQVMSDSQTLQESQSLSMFLATQHKIKESLKGLLVKIDNYDELLADIINLCLYLYEKQLYITPSEKHLLVKVIGFALYLIDGDGGNLKRLEERKRINLTKIDDIFSQLEIVPLFGDMSVQPFAFVKKSQFYDASRWPEASKPLKQCQINLVEKLTRVKQQHIDFVSKLSCIHNEMGVIVKDGPRSDAENKELTELALRGVRLLTLWSCHVVEAYSWKLLNLADPHQNQNCPADAEEYERATRYNYSNEEKAALIELIAMIKGLQTLLGKMETEFNQAIRRHVYAEMQDFVQIGLKEPLRKATKNKKEFIRSIIQSVRETCADYMQGFDPHADLMSTKKKDVHGSGDIRIPRKAVGPSVTQLYMVRTMLESLLFDRSSGKKTHRKDIDSQHLAAIGGFLKQSYFWNSLLNFSRCLEECCDLSQLWYREFYLEMTMGKRIQFPIEMSMPWILIDHILTSKDASLIECVLYQLDLYNDSASFALTKFKKQYLYDEIEAEVNLCFDQFVYKLSDHIFGYFKQIAACALLDKRFSAEMVVYGIGNYWDFPKCTRYQTLLRQRHVQLLGRSVDLNRLVTQRINAAIKASIDNAISRFEAGDITDVMELDGLIQLNKLCHRLLKDHMPGLADFKDLFLEANHNVSAPYGRITLHIFWELCYDFLQRYSYNASTDRFVPCKQLSMGDRIERAKPPQAEPQYFWGSRNLNSAYGNMYMMYKGFVGAPHFRAMVKLLGYEGIAVVFDELLKICQTLIQGTLLQYTSELMKVMPKVCKTPKFEYGSSGIFEYYREHLKNIISYSDLRTDMFQSFRELGNSILFFMHIEQALSQEEILDLIHAAPFQNVIPRPYCAEGEKDKADQKLKRLEQKYSKLQVCNIIEKFGNGKQSFLAREGDLLTKERLCCGLSLFEVILTRLKAFLSQDPKVWVGPPPGNGVMHIDECCEFYRLWSAIQFIYCMPTGENEFNIEEIFGEGLNWAGCTMIVLLGQQRRFDALDFSYYFQRVQRSDMADSLSLNRMADRIRKFQVLNNQIFATLNKYVKSSETANADGSTSIEHVRCFQPPIHQSLANRM